MEDEKCQDCEYWAEQGAAFCGRCGRMLAEPADLPVKKKTNLTERDSFQNKLLIIGALLVPFILIISIIYIIAGYAEGQASFNALGNVYYGILIVIVLLCFAYAVKSVLGSIRTSRDPEASAANSGLASAGMAVAVLITITIVYVLLTSFMQDIDPSYFDKYTKLQMAVMLLAAGAEEELIFRMLMVGVPSAVLFAAVRKPHASHALLGGFGLSKAAWIIIIVSGLAFGLAHLSSWNFAKVPQAAIGGIVFGYIFVKYGIYASILAHSTLDCLTVTVYALGDWFDATLSLGLLALGSLFIICEFIRLHERRSAPELTTFGEDMPKKVSEMWRRD